MVDIQGTDIMTQTFIFAQRDVKGNTIKIRGTEAHHISGVLRLGKGDMIRVIDGQGTAHICEIKSCASKAVTCAIVKTVKYGGEPGLDLALAIGLSTATKFDTVVEKGTEVGVSRFIPLSTEKGKVKIREQGSLTRRMNRWRRVCEAAVKQSGRSIIPAITPPLLFTDFIAACIPQETVLFHPESPPADFQNILSACGGKRLTIIVGPESGLSQSEVDLARERGIAILGLGERILRTETAGVVLPAMAIYLAEHVKWHRQ
jgi:16S rRNA (uracil1498-N3)-methyltransferase